MRLKFSAHHPGPGRCQRKHLLCSGDPDIAESPLFLDFLVRIVRVHGHTAREKAFLHAGHVDDREFKALGRMQRHEQHAVVGILDGIYVRDQRNFLQKA